MLRLLTEVLFWGAAGMILLVLAGNPLCIYIASSLRLRRSGIATAPEPMPQESPLPSVSIIVVAYRPGPLLERKLENCLALKYPPELLEIVYSSDGEDAEAAALCQLRASSIHEAGTLIQCVETQVRRGKAASLNAAVARARGEILVFSDVDAILREDAVGRLVQRFFDPAVGGVGGRRIIAAEKKHTGAIQALYWQLEAWLKTQESYLGTVTSNDGKLYAIRRTLFEAIPEAVTDDLYSCLAVLRKKYRFEYEPEAIATAPVPSRDDLHEVTRRRRIVCRSLYGVWLSRALLNPFAFGWLAVRLFINKVLRRMLPLALVLLCVASLLLSFSSAAYAVIFFMQLSGYALAMLHPLLRQARHVPRGLEKASTAAWYVCLGMYGTWLGLVDCIRGRRVAMWLPVKSG